MPGNSSCGLWTLRAHFGRSVRGLGAPCGRWTRRASFGQAAQCRERSVRGLDALRSAGDALRSPRDALCELWTRCAVQGSRCAVVGTRCAENGRAVLMAGRIERHLVPLDRAFGARKRLVNRGLRRNAYLRPVYILAKLHSDSQGCPTTHPLPVRSQRQASEPHGDAHDFSNPPQPRP